MPYLTREQVEQTRMPAEWKPPQQIQNPFAFAGQGMGMPGPTGQPAGFAGDPLGQVDPAALRASAQGGDYDIEARRNAIAARIAANAAAQAAYGAGGAGGAGSPSADEAMYGKGFKRNPNPSPASPLIGLMGYSDPDRPNGSFF